MDIGVLGIVVIAAIGVAWHRNSMRQSPQFAAFSTAFAAILFTVTGLAGFGLQKGIPLFSEARWSETVIWPQVWLGLAFLVVSVFCWHKAIKDTDRRLRRP
jgi:hypothetical protein